MPRRPLFSRRVTCRPPSREVCSVSGTLRRSPELGSSLHTLQSPSRTSSTSEGNSAARIIILYPNIQPSHCNKCHSFTFRYNNRPTLLTISQWENANRLHQIKLLLAKHGIETNPGPTSQDSLTISHVNINSITSPYRLHELHHFVDINHIDLLALTETKLDNTVHPDLYHIPDFHDPLTNHRTRHGGGTALYARTSLPIKRIPELELFGEEWIWAQIKCQNESFIICCVYLPPNASAERQTEFLDKLTESATNALTYSPNSVIILGDINVGNIYLKRLLPNSGNTPFDIRLKETTDALQLTQLIDEPTRPDSGNLRDLIFVSNPENITSSGVLSPFSQIDHLPIYAVIKTIPPISTSKGQKRIWDYSRLDAQRLTNILMNTDWDQILVDDVDEAAQNFNSTILDAAKIAIPMKTQMTGRQQKPWMTSDLYSNIRKRNRLFTKARRTQTVYDWDRWKRQRNYVTALNKQTRDDFLRSKVNTLLEQKQTPYRYHATLKSIMGRGHRQTIPPITHTDGSIVTDDKEKAILLNSFFGRQSENDADDDSDLLRQENLTSPPKINNINITPSMVLSQLNSLVPNKASGSDGVPPKLLKLIALFIYEPLTKLFNLCLKASKFPDIWKRANIHPIYKKKGSPSDPTNYRPISLLPCLSKIFEKLIFNHIYKHITDHSLLSQKQSGYRPGHGTEVQLIHLTHNIYSNLDK